MADAKEDRTVGKVKCPLCGNVKAPVRLNKRDLAYLTCNNCNMQLFARSDRSDEALRALILPGDPLPSAPVVDDANPAPVPAADPAPAAKAKGKGATRNAWEPF